MENENVNGHSDLKKMFADYQNKQTQSSTKKSGKDFLAKYFTPRNTKEIFRILPPKQGKERIEHAYFHVVPTNITGGGVKENTVVYCPAHNDPKVKKLDTNGNVMLDSNNNPIMIPSPCPLCEKHKRLISKQDSSIKYIKKDKLNDAQLKIKESNDKIYAEAVKWEAKKFYIIRGVDKGAEKDGVKFWRFKHNYKNQGTLDKLLPILNDYFETQNCDYSDVKNGTDLSIIMTDSEYKGKAYKTISAITTRGKSPLHSDPLIERQWLEDNITWRDVFIPKKAPNITPYEYLEMVLSGTTPYWDDKDESNKHWVFPGRPDLEELANSRERNLDGDDDDDFEQASDIDYESSYSNVTISNVTENNMAKYTDDSVNVTAEVMQSKPVEPINLEPTPVVEKPIDVVPTSSTTTDYDDLPF